MSLMESFP